MRGFVVVLVIFIEFLSSSAAKVEGKSQFAVENVGNAISNFMEAHQDFKTFVILSEVPDVTLKLTKLTTVVLALNLNLTIDMKFIKLLSTHEKALLTTENSNILLNETEKFLQSFWLKYKTGRIFVHNHKALYFFDPLHFDFESGKFGKLKNLEGKSRKPDQKRPWYPIRIEHFTGTYSELRVRGNQSSGFAGPDIDLTNILISKMNFHGKFCYS
jgi:hypothetical protein